MNSNLTAFYGENHMKYMNTVRGHNTVFLEVKFGGTCRNHCILRFAGPMFISVLTCFSYQINAQFIHSIIIYITL